VQATRRLRLKDNFNAEENLGATLVSLRRYQEALPHLQNAARIRPQSAISYMNIASALASSGRKRDAIAEYERAIPLATDSAMLSVAYDALGKLHSELGNYSMAHASYQQALRITPELLSARRGLAEVEFSETKRSIAEAPSGEGFLRLGQLLQQAGRASEARLAYQQALKLDPKLVEARQALAAMAPGH